MISRPKKAAVALAILAACILFYGTLIEPYWIEVNEFPIKIDGSLQGIIVAQLSDLHLNSLGRREMRMKSLLTREIRPDVLVFTGDTFDPFGEQYKMVLAPHVSPLLDFLVSLPGEKYLVWGEIVFNNRHFISRELSKRGIQVLEDESVISENFPELAVTGKLPELADFHVVDERGGCLGSGFSELNSFLHYEEGDSFGWKNYDYLASVRFTEDSGDLGLTFYSSYGRENDRFYRVRWSGSSPRPYLSGHGTGALMGTTTARHEISQDRWTRFRIRCETENERTRLRVRYWAENESEPTVWALDAYDESDQRLSCGTVGVWVNTGSHGSLGSERLFEDLVVVDKRGKRTLLEESFDIQVIENKSLKEKGWRTERLFSNTIYPELKAELHLLLSHSAGIIDSYEIGGFRILLAGDTHGGQICWPWGAPVLPTPNLPDGWHSGMYEHNGMKVYINRGLGTSRLPVRLFCRPEISVFRFEGRPASESEGRNGR